MSSAPTFAETGSFAALRTLFAIPLLASLAAWAVLWVALPPAEQNFPLGDDWAFSHGMFEFVKGNGIHYFQWASMPQLGQWLWATPFVWLLGASHVALRISALVLSWLGLWAFYGLLRYERCSDGQAALATAALALNPLFFLMQGTFLTDVPALAFALAALMYYTRAIHEGRFTSLL